MTDRYVLPLRTALASNTGGPYTHAWDRVPVPTDGTLRSAWATARSIASNTIQNKVDIYYQSDAPSAGSNTATTVLTSPITLVNNRDSVEGTISQAGQRVSAGGVLELRTYSGTTAATPSFLDLAATVEIERDPD